MFERSKEGQAVWNVARPDLVASLFPSLTFHPAEHSQAGIEAIPVIAGASKQEWERTGERERANFGEGRGGEDRHRGWMKLFLRDLGHD